MALLNYTTTIAVDKTLAEVQRLLAKQGARSILTEYDGSGNPQSVSFLIGTAFGDRGFRLPADTEAVWRVLTKQWNQGRVPRRFVTREQAARVAWRIIKDWLEAQLALIETEMVSLEQIMLPYMTMDDGRSLYQVMRERQFALPAGSRS